MQFFKNKISNKIDSLKHSFQSFFQNKNKKIEIFVRHCHYSRVSQHKERYPGFSKLLAYKNFLETIDEALVNVTFILDSFYPAEDEHFVKKQDRFPVIEIKEGTETGSFLKLLDHVSALNLNADTIVYFLEDDYFHRPGWVHVMQEGFGLPDIDYVTLYDHKDKYFLPAYRDLKSKIFATESCHWRTTPSTTNTFAARYGTLMKHIQIHREFSLNREISSDHEKFCKLGEMSSVLISSIPGWSTHAELGFASPCVDWKKVIHVDNKEQAAFESRSV